MKGNVSESTWARLSALGLVVALGLIVAVALAGRPAQLRPMETLAAVLEPTLTPAATPIELTIRVPRTQIPKPTPSPTPSPTRHKILGEDGIFGVPGWPWRAPAGDSTR